MPGRQAKIITASMLRRMLSFVGGTAFTKRDRVIILLSVKAGLRACEIAQLDWTMVLDARGRVGAFVAVEDAIAKRQSGRRIPLHADLRRALVRLKGRGTPSGPVIHSARGSAMRPNSIVNWLIVFFEALAFEGCSSHSGRRTFITAAARNAHKAGCSLRDVQLLAKPSLDRRHAKLYRWRLASPASARFSDLRGTAFRNDSAFFAVGTAALNIRCRVLSGDISHLRARVTDAAIP
jgi:integrase